jgi:formylglycine-generating enzyme required for sulfatase activity
MVWYVCEPVARWTLKRPEGRAPFARRDSTSVFGISSHWRHLQLGCCAALTLALGLASARSQSTAPVESGIFPAGTNGVRTTWKATPGRSYLLQSTTNLSVPWGDALPAPGPLTATTNSLSQIFAIDALARFFRVLEVTDAAPPGMVRIPAGTFVMGSPATEKEREYFFSTDETQHTVTLTKDFYMSQYEVTQKEFLAVLGNNPSYFTTKDYNGNSISPDLNRPVEQVSWHDATNYCGKLTSLERATGRLPAGWEYRLPTEAEWEYACRAGTSTAFHYGDALRGGMANFWSYLEYDASVGNINVSNPTAFLGHTTTVGSYAPNAFGLYDMHGNVWEWCLDWYDDYPKGSVSDPRGPSTGSYRVFRGGSWGYYARFCRSADRYFHRPAEGSFNIGFRPVLAPVQ